MIARLAALPQSFVGPQDDLVLVLSSVAIIGAVVVLVAFFRTRLQIIERRLVVIRELAQRGHLTREDLQPLLNPGARWLKAVLVVAWFALLGGLALLTAALIEGWPWRYCAFGAPSVGILGVALATLSAPVVLREYRRQGVV